MLICWKYICSFVKCDELWWFGGNVDALESLTQTLITIGEQSFKCVCIPHSNTSKQKALGYQPNYIKQNSVATWAEKNIWIDYNTSKVKHRDIPNNTERNACLILTDTRQRKHFDGTPDNTTSTAKMLLIFQFTFCIAFQ